jgi:hypothetical protein
VVNGRLYYGAVVVSWAIVIEGRTDKDGILMLCDDQQEAESIASEMRRRGHPVEVRRQVERP